MPCKEPSWACVWMALLLSPASACSAGVIFFIPPHPSWGLDLAEIKRAERLAQTLRQNLHEKHLKGLPTGVKSSRF